MQCWIFDTGFVLLFFPGHLQHVFNKKRKIMSTTGCQQFYKFALLCPFPREAGKRRKVLELPQTGRVSYLSPKLRSGPLLTKSYWDRTAVCDGWGGGLWRSKSRYVVHSTPPPPPGTPDQHTAAVRGLCGRVGVWLTSGCSTTGHM